ncbi:MAG TPA: LptA/OstA family protein [Aliidongia sp.]|nr:LptA/OstA family protein [Aliidongia sp.]
MIATFRRFLPFGVLLSAALGPAALAADKPAPKPSAVQPAPAQPAPAQSAPAPSAPGQPAAGQAPATGAVGGLSAGQGPIDITADESLEYHQTDKAYVARGNAIAKRGDRTVYADTLSVYYRDIPNSSQTEPWRYVAEGHVRVTTPTQSVVGDHGIYDLDTKTVVMTGQGLKLTTPNDVVTARDSLEWYDDKQVAVARGDGLAIRTTPHGERRMRGDILVAQVAQAPGEAQRISRVDGQGHVVVTAPGQIGTGDKGVYNVDTGIATLAGHVTLTRGDNTLVGEYGVVDTDKGLSRLLARPPSGQDPTHGRVQGYIVPKKRAEQGNAKPADTPSAPQKAQP